MTIDLDGDGDPSFKDIMNIPKGDIKEIEETWSQLQSIMIDTREKFRLSKTHNKTMAIKKAMTPTITIVEGDRVGQENSYGLAPFGVDETSGLVSHPIHAPLLTEGAWAWNQIDNVARAFGEERLPKNSRPSGNVYKDISKLRFTC